MRFRFDFPDFCSELLHFFDLDLMEVVELAVAPLLVGESFCFFFPDLLEVFFSLLEVCVDVGVTDGQCKGDTMRRCCVHSSKVKYF